MTPASLAIVIPAWKPDFFAEALESIARQTNQDFHVYIGDDNGSPLLRGIAEEKLAGLPYTYQRFEKNMGGSDLVGHWQRCLAMVGTEEWIWLFSDDDVMDPHCVEAFHQARSRQDADLYRFEIEVITSDSKLSHIPVVHDWTDISEFIQGRMVHGHTSFVIEWIFRRSRFEEVGGFQRFDLAWCSDDATWIKVGSRQPPVLVRGAPVRWRKSNQNISPDERPETVWRKTNSRIDFMKWLKHEQYSDKTCPMSDFLLHDWLRKTMRPEITFLTIGQAIQATSRFQREVAGVGTRGWWTLAKLLGLRQAKLVRNWWRRAR